MSALGKFVKSALVAGAFTAATAAQSASVPLGSFTISGAADFTVTTTNPGSTNYPNSFLYEIVMGAYDQWVTFTLADTNPDGTPVRYKVWEDSADAVNSVQTGGTLLAYPYDGSKDYITDVVNSANIPFFKVLLKAGDQYVLEINKTAQNWSQISTGVSAVPLPGAIWMFGTALLGFLGFSSRRKV